MNAANVIKAAELTTTLRKVRYAASRNPAGSVTTISVAGQSPISIGSAITAGMLTALESHLIAELTALGVTQLEAA